MCPLWGALRGLLGAALWEKVFFLSLSSRMFLKSEVWGFEDCP